MSFYGRYLLLRRRERRHTRVGIGIDAIDAVDSVGLGSITPCNDILLLDSMYSVSSDDKSADSISL